MPSCFKCGSEPAAREIEAENERFSDVWGADPSPRNIWYCHDCYDGACRDGRLLAFVEEMLEHSSQVEELLANAPQTDPPEAAS